MRTANETDLDAIVAIYNATIASRQSTADTNEVSVESRRAWFHEHDPNKRLLLVYEENGQIIAWVSFQSFYGRPAYDHTCELSIYLSPECRGKGLGKKLLSEALDLTQSLQIKTVLGFIFSHNTPSIRLFKALGFEIWSELPNVTEMDGKEYSVAILGKRGHP
ncbi:MAG: Putative phosphinothricin acetyltransferase YwnH [Candidatus Celerinatantimonas neptuna]|nr:MAG: Putative phosphinothricin acetyltransferase YwnH [Candidatus Celerinatantimonas neptuna]